MTKLVQKERNGQRWIMAAVYRGSVVAREVYGNPGCLEGIVVKESLASGMFWHKRAADDCDILAPRPREFFHGILSSKSFCFPCLQIERKFYVCVGFQFLWGLEKSAVNNWRILLIASSY